MRQNEKIRLNRLASTFGGCTKAVGFTIVLIVVSLFGTSAVRAEVHVQGNATAVEVDIEDHARIAEVLSALGQAFNVRYRTSIALDGVIGGTYAGSLGEVISRVLDGYNFFIMQNGNALAVVVLGKSNNRSVPLASTPNFTPKRDSTNRRRRD